MTFLDIITFKFHVLAVDAGGNAIQFQGHDDFARQASSLMNEQAQAPARGTRLSNTLKKEYEAEAVHHRRWTDSRHKHPTCSIVFNPGMKRLLLNDFLKSEMADRVISFRGVLLNPCHHRGSSAARSPPPFPAFRRAASSGILGGVAASERYSLRDDELLERLDPALSRPGCMDMWVEFWNASEWQAEAFLGTFFLSREESAMKGVEAGNELRGIDLPTTAAAVVDAVEHVAVAVGFALALAGVHQVDHARARPRDVRREEKGIHASVGRREHRLSGAFGKAAGYEEFSVAALQGYLLKNKSNPEAAAGEVAAWGLGSLASVNYVGGSHGRGDA
ncbi:hypothetical protein FIBSPDRAFT_894047 [Athelia psychrophila]|uniref:Mitochondrial chaperone BCS1-like ATPase lid domain-containing protein n=1 Tax=Athelia psychrophila TaxID=1759441 RepID=A0A166GAK1_9AGAM|nr:hypothetical protein FIBSPDRAFT_894047 [Fibularhizoctonia sp. CBS 109695]